MILIPVVVSSSPISHPSFIQQKAHWSVGFLLFKPVQFPMPGNQHQFAS
jgi:hypothetical protein